MTDHTLQEATTGAASASALAVVSRKLAVEAIGTFFLVFTVTSCVLSGSAFTPLAVAAVLMVMVYAGGHVSGAHYNPAVTLAALLRGRISLTDAVGYWVTQLVAGVVAGIVGRVLVDPPTVKTLHLAGHGLWAAAVAELLFTFALCYVVLNVATSRSTDGNSFFGLAIGFTVGAGAFAVGGLSGGVFNPAVALGGATGGLFAWSTLWMYVVVQVVAGAAAGLAFKALNPGDK